MIRNIVFVMLIAVVVTWVVQTAGAVVKLQGRAVAVYVDDMHCKQCAKKIARKLYTVPGVTAVHADVSKNLALITPQQGKDPSPRSLWEAVEAAEFKPVKLIGPRGTFFKKPNF